MPIKPITSTFSEQGELEIGGISATALVKEFGSPLYVMDQATLEHNCRQYTETLKAVYPNHIVTFAGKANLNVGLLNILAQEGLGVDVVSGGEIVTALKSQMKPENIIFHGNNKSIDELTLAIQNGIKLMVDNDQELKNIVAVTEKLNQKASLLIRLKPEIEAHTHDFIKTGQIDSKFGLDLKNLIPFIQKIQAHPRLHLVGIHSHIGSQIFDCHPFEELARLMVKHAVEIREATGVTVAIINCGGGMGIQYTEQDDPPLISDYLEKLTSILKQECEKNQFPLPKLMVEPGRSIVGNAGVTLYTVGTIKSIPGVKDYVFVDGGMADNPRPMLYQAQYTFTIANKARRPHTHPYAVAGKYCESGDVLTHRVSLPEAEVGDVVCVFGTGAYNYSMASNYNRCLRPAMVLVHQKQARILVKRESFDDILRNDVA